MVEAVVIVGRQKEKIISGSLVKKLQESGRGGLNRQYYATIYDDLSRQEYTLRGSVDYFYNKRDADTLSVVLKEGSLGILYLEKNINKDMATIRRLRPLFVAHLICFGVLVGLFGYWGFYGV